MNLLYKIWRNPYLRVPAKWIAFLLVVLAVCYPKPILLYRDLGRWRNPNMLVEPESPDLQPLVDEAASSVPPGTPARSAMKYIEQLVLARIDYQYDWDNWGVVDYLPTVKEIMERGREDCDGRAIIAASLLRRFGYNAYLVADFEHMWVRTNEGDLMSPGKTDAVVSGEGGARLTFKALKEFPSAFAFGIAVFPRVREAIIILAAWLLMLRRNHATAAIASLVLMFVGLYLLRRGGIDPRQPVVWMNWLSLVCFVAAVFTLLIGKNRSPNAGNTDLPDANHV